MAKHASGKEAPGQSKRLFFVVPVCLVIGVFAVYLGVTVIGEPATCDFQTMSANDLCRHGSKGLQTLITDGALNHPNGTYRDLADQQSYNRTAGPIYIVCGLLFIGMSLFLGALLVRAFRTKRSKRQPR